MLFQVYGENALYQWLGWAIVFIGLILINEVARRTKAGGVFCFIVLPVALTRTSSPFPSAPASASSGRSTTHARAHEQLVPLREALRGHHRVHRLHGHQVLVGRYRQGALVQVLPVRHRAINILIAVVSDFESASAPWGTTWVSSEASRCTAVGTTCSTAWRASSTSPA